MTRGDGCNRGAPTAEERRSAEADRRIGLVDVGALQQRRRGALETVTVSDIDLVIDELLEVTE